PFRILFLFSFSFYRSPHRPYLHSFPTRRSSDLPAEMWAENTSSLVFFILLRLGVLAASAMFFAFLFKGFFKRQDDEARHYLEIRSEEHTSELQSRFDLVCRLLLEKKKKKKT